MQLIDKSLSSNVLDRRDQPVVFVDPGETIIVETQDAHGGYYGSVDDVRPERLAEPRPGNKFPVTGPIFVREAEPGDVLLVRIDHIELANQGATTARPGGGLLGDWMDEAMGLIVPVAEGVARFNNRFDIPLRPMIGKIGVAPAIEAIRSSTPGPHGGNMDCVDITTGSTVYLPVFVPGALLYAGDVHAVMGDGEICGTGVEIASRLTLTISVQKGRPVSMNWPRIETANEVMVIAADKPVESAARLACKDMILWMEENGFRRPEAYLLFSLAGDVRICQLVNPLYTVRAVLPKQYLIY